MSLLDTASLIVTPNGYKEGKLYSVIPSDGSGDLSVTRATTATRVNSQGLVELVPYNLIWYSEQFDNVSYWGLEQISVTANSTTAPNGTTTADTITDSSTFGYTYQSVPISGGVGSIVTHSVFLKRTNNDWVNVAASRTPGTTYGEFGVWFNLATGAIGSNFQAGVGVVVDSEITDEGNGWYRCSVTGYVPNAVGYVPYVFNSNADNSFTSSAGKSRYQWGAQLVEGSVAKDYQKTETRLNIPRLDYSNGTCPSILVEPQRTNLFLYSSSFDSAAWNYVSAVKTPNATISPSGNTDAQQLEFNSGYIFTSAVTSASATSSISCYAKKGTANTFVIQEANYVGTSVTFDLNNGTVTSGTGTIEDVGNGWYRCTTQFAYGSGQTTATWAFRNYQSGYIYLWGAQLEVGSYPTSYIPTTSASVTRNADVISKTGISSLIGQTEGSVFLDLYFELKQQSNFLIQLTDGTNDFIELYIAGGIMYFSGYNGASQWTISTSLTDARHKIAYAYKANDIALYVDGVLIGTDTSAAIPTCNNLYLNQDLFGQYNQQQYYNATALWKTRLTNTQLAQLTTI